VLGLWPDTEIPLAIEVRSATLYIDVNAAVANEELGREARYNLKRGTGEDYEVTVKRRMMRDSMDLVLVLDGGGLD
jgi:hypothetical protein